MSGTEQYYKYLVQYRVGYNVEWQEDLPLIDHPDSVTTSRVALNHTIYNLLADTYYDVQIAVCRVWDGLRGECVLAHNPVVSVRTGEKDTWIRALLMNLFVMAMP